MERAQDAFLDSIKSLFGKKRLNLHNVTSDFIRWVKLYPINLKNWFLAASTSSLYGHRFIDVLLIICIGHVLAHGLLRRSKN